MSDYICPQCGQTYDMLGVCDICGVDLQSNDTEKRDGDEEEEGLNELGDEGYDDTDDGSDDILGVDLGDGDDDDDEFDDE